LKIQFDFGRQEIKRIILNSLVNQY